LDGTVVSQDGSEDRKLYGRDVRNQDVLMGEVPAPAAARALIAELSRYSPATH
jgi:lipid-binding SYLF domain-containing protein